MMTTLTPYMHPTLTFHCADEAETAALAALVARFAGAADLIRLHGDLGAGKSTFTRYFLRALGYQGDIPSPTYTVAQLYATGRINVAHLDCYRLADPLELDALDLQAYREHGVILAEWPDNGGMLVAGGQPDYLSYHINNPDNGGTLDVFLSAGTSAEGRTIRLDASPSWQRRFGLMFADKRRSVSIEGRQAFLESLGLGPFTMDALPGDWSGRSYARMHLADGTSRMLMDSPPPWEGTEDFAKVAEYYRSIGLRGPEIYAQDAAHGYMLTEDFGTTRLLDLIEGKGLVEKSGWYTAAVDVLLTMHRAMPMATARRYAPRDWWVETARWIDWYLPFATGRSATLAERAHIQKLWMDLYATVMDSPQATLPWDYQATNLMILGDTPSTDNLGLIDIQDARTAPVAQDLAILLRDIRRPQDDALEQAMVTHAAAELAMELERLQTLMDMTSLHHCVRIIGGLARSVVRDGKTGGAESFMARTWQVAHQSYANPILKDIVDFIAPFEAPGLARLESLTHTPGVAHAFKPT